MLRMRSESNISGSIYGKMIIVLFLLFLSATGNEAARILSHSRKGVIQMTNEHLLLPSLQWNSVRPPSPNGGTNSLSTDMTSQITERNFAGLKATKEYLLLPSLQWNSVRPPSPNGGTNSLSTDRTSQITERNFAGRKTTKEYLLLPSLQGNSVRPPSPNGDTNSLTTDMTSQISERNFAHHKEVPFVVANN